MLAGRGALVMRMTRFARALQREQPFGRAGQQPSAVVDHAPNVAQYCRIRLGQAVKVGHDSAMDGRLRRCKASLDGAECSGLGGAANPRGRDLAKKLTRYILLALVLGIIAGWAINAAIDDGTPGAAERLKAIAGYLAS